MFHLKIYRSEANIAKHSDVTKLGGWVYKCSLHYSLWFSTEGKIPLVAVWKMDWVGKRQKRKQRGQKTFEVQWEMTSSTNEDKNWGPEKRVKLRDTKKIKSARLGDRSDIRRTKWKFWVHRHSSSKLENMWNGFQEMKTYWDWRA